MPETDDTEGRDKAGGEEQQPAPAEVRTGSGHGGGSTGATEEGGGAPPPGRLRLALVLGVAVLALLLALAALAGAGYGYYRGRAALHRQTRMQQTLAELSAAQQRTSQTLVPKQVFDQRIGSLQDRLNTLQQKFAASETMLKGLQALANGGREAWQRDEIAYLLKSAQQTLELRHDPATALQALQLADNRLEQMGNPRYLPVRKAIADEITALRAVPRPDVAGIALQLSSLSQQADGWPLAHPSRPRPPAGLAPSAQQRLPEHWWQRTLHSLVAVFREMVVIRHHAKPIQPLVPPQQAQLVRMIASLRLDLARTALLQGDPRVFGTQLEAARDWIRRYFDTRRTPVRAALAELGKLQEVQLAPKLPDISGSLEKLHQIEHGQAKGPVQ